jgi:hypothetical protein
LLGPPSPTGHTWCCTTGTLERCLCTTQSVPIGVGGIGPSPKGPSAILYLVQLAEQLLERVVVAVGLHVGNGTQHTIHDQLTRIQA